MTKNVTIVGAGALGSHLVQFLRDEDIAIRVIDFDRVEQKNVRAQFHSKIAVGRVKTVALQQVMNYLWGVKIESIPTKLTRDNRSQLLAGPDLIIDCLDNGEARREVREFALTQGPLPMTMTIQGDPKIHFIGGPPLLHGALAADGSFARVVWDEHFTIDDEPTTGAATCEDGRHLPFIAMTAAYLARAAQSFLRDGKRLSWEISPTRAWLI